MLFEHLKVRFSRSKLKKFDVNVSDEPLRSAYHFVFEHGATLRHVKCVGRSFSLTMGADSYWRSGVAIGSVSIGRFCSIASNVRIGLEKNGHPSDWLSSSPAQYSESYLCKNRMLPSLSYEPVLNTTTIGSDVWIGDGAIVMNGVDVGVGAIIASGAIVTKSVPAYAVVAGVPARVVKYRFEREIIQRMLDSCWWCLPINFLENLPFASVDECLLLLESRGSERIQPLFEGGDYGRFVVDGIKC